MLALLYLDTHERDPAVGARIRKSFDWDAMNRLHEKGLISNTVGKAKSAAITEAGLHKAELAFRAYSR